MQAQDFGGDFHRLPAGFAQLAVQPLGLRAQERGREHEPVDSHVEHAGDGAGGVVRVQGAEDEVARYGGLHRDRGGLVVADFADHDDVRGLAEDRAQAAREGQPHLRVGLHLVDALQLVFDGVLDGDHVHVACVQLLERGVERGGLAAAGRSGHQHHPVRLGDGVLEVFVRPLIQPQRGETGRQRGLVENTHDDLLAVDGGKDAHANVALLLLRAHLEAAVLRNAVLRDVHVGEDLEARHDGVVHGLRRAGEVVENAVDAVAEHHVLLHRLEMNIACLPAQRLHHDRVHDADDRCAHGLLFQVRRLRLDLLVLGDFHVVVDGLLERLFQRFLLSRESFEQFVDVALRRDERNDVVLGHRAKIVQGQDVERVAERDRQRVAHPGHGHGQVPLHRVLGHQFDQLLVGSEVREGDGRHPDVFGQRQRQLAGRDQVPLDQQFFDRLPQRLRLLADDVEEVALDVDASEQDREDSF